MFDPQKLTVDQLDEQINRVGGPLAGTEEGKLDEWSQAISCVVTKSRIIEVCQALELATSLGKGLRASTFGALFTMGVCIGIKLAEQQAEVERLERLARE